MCKHYTEDQTALKFGAAYAGIENPPEPEHTEIWPKRKAHVVIETDRGRSFALLRWGVWPFFARDKPQFIHNARDDSLLTKSTWKKSVAIRRCLIPASSYYEPGLGGPGEVRITLRQRPVFFIAGLWDFDPDGSGSTAFSMVTTVPNDCVAPFQDRMPVVLDDAGAAAWLGHTPLTPEQIAALCRPCPAEAMATAAMPAPVRKIKKTDLAPSDGELKLE